MRILAGLRQDRLRELTTLPTPNAGFNGMGGEG